MNKIRVGIIDDDETKRTQIISALREGVNKAPEEVMEQYRDYELVPVELKIQADLNDVLENIIIQRIDALIIDYQLSSYESHVEYTGVGIADRTDRKFLGFPVFVLTSFESDLYKHEVFDAYKVFDFERYMNEDKERIELNRKMIEQYVKRHKEIAWKQNEFSELLKRAGIDQETDDKILELDDFLERSIDGDYAISKQSKERLIDKRFDEMLRLLHKVLEER